MAQILSDEEIRSLLGSVLVDAEEGYVRPNSIELRLGKEVRFLSTGETRSLEEGDYLKIHPSETVTICSYERIDFRGETVQKVFPESMLMGFITPTTTMMREGIAQVATKVDAGFHGDLNWSLRNGSTNEIVIGYGEPLFKLTIFRLKKSEVPSVPYGKGKRDSYHESEGIVRSKRKIPVDIPEEKLVESGFADLDPDVQLRQAGHPFDHIGTQLQELDGRFEVISNSVGFLEEKFQERTEKLSEKIDNETTTLSNRLEGLRDQIVDKVESMFNRKVLRLVGVIIGAAPILYGAATLAEAWGLSGDTVAVIGIAVGLLIIVGSIFVSRLLDPQSG